MISSRVIPYSKPFHTVPLYSTTNSSHGRLTHRFQNNNINKMDLKKIRNDVIKGTGRYISKDKTL
jgi:hypothetical protein